MPLPPASTPSVRADRPQPPLSPATASSRTPRNVSSSIQIENGSERECISTIADERLGFRLREQWKSRKSPRTRWIDVILCPACALPAYTHGASNDLGVAGGYAIMPYSTTFGLSGWCRTLRSGTEGSGGKARTVPRLRGEGGSAREAPAHPFLPRHSAEAPRRTRRFGYRDRSMEDSQRRALPSTRGFGAQSAQSRPPSPRAGGRRRAGSCGASSQQAPNPELGRARRQPAAAVQQDGYGTGSPGGLSGLGWSLREDTQARGRGRCSRRPARPAPSRLREDCRHLRGSLRVSNSFAASYARSGRRSAANTRTTWCSSIRRSCSSRFNDRLSRDVDWS